MSKKGKSKRSTVQPVTQRSWWLWAVAAAVILIVGGLSYILIMGVNGPETGTPKFVVDQTEIDEGYQKLGTTVHTSFKLRNKGDATLRVLGEPQVKAVEGCWPPRAVVSSTTIKPGQEAELSMDYMMHEGMDGPHRFEVTLQTNDPKNPQMILVAKSNWGP